MGGQNYYKRKQLSEQQGAENEIADIYYRLFIGDRQKQIDERSRQARGFGFYAAVVKFSRKCNMHEITAPSRTWGFPSNLSCSTTDATTTGGAGAGVLRCKYIYMCPSTQQQQQQQQQLYRRNIKVTILECRRNGKWFGKLPDCSLGKLTRYRNELAAPAVAAAAAVPGSQAGVKPRSNFVNRE